MFMLMLKAWCSAAAVECDLVHHEHVTGHLHGWVRAADIDDHDDFAASLLQSESALGQFMTLTLDSSAETGHTWSH